MYRLVLSLCAALVLPSTATPESPANRGDTLVSLSSRVFDLGEHSPILDRQLEDDFVSLSDVRWIYALTQADPYLAGTVIHINDRSTGRGEPAWAPDGRSRFHPDDSLPPIFDLDFYEVGWQGAVAAPVRGSILMFPRHDPQSFYARCAYDRADVGPKFCSVNFRYGPDRYLSVRTRIYQVTLPLNDFAEIAARVNALVRCLDVTEAVRAGEANPSADQRTPADIAAGDDCRLEPVS